MADSDNSTTLPSVTRRRLMAGAAAVSASWSVGVSTREHSLGRLPRDDPALGLCESWQKTHDETLALCREQQRLETYLARKIGFPWANPRLRYGGDVTLHSSESLKEITASEDEGLWSKAVKELASHQARWDAADAEVGYSKTQALERKSEAAEQALLDGLP